MIKFETKLLPKERNYSAPDGSDVRLLLRLGEEASMAHFALAPGQVSKAVTHKTRHEMWYFLTGLGQMWLKQNETSAVVDVQAGVCVTIPQGTHFQFRSFDPEPLSAIGVTIPSWPLGEEGEHEAIIVPEGKWQPTVE